MVLPAALPRGRGSERMCRLGEDVRGRSRELDILFRDEHLLNDDLLAFAQAFKDFGSGAIADAYRYGDLA
jgi:hypothetical protein